MALVRRISTAAKERQTVHDETECAASIFTDAEGHTYLQLDTVGSSQRKIPGKVSQAIQFDEGAAAKLKQLIEQAFPRLKG